MREQGSPPALRAGRRTNDALLWLLLAALLSGALVFALAGPAAAVVVVAHGLCGVAVVALVPWKRVIVRRSRRSLVLGLVLAALVVVCLAAGLWQTVIGYGPSAVSPIQVHVGAALVLIPLLAAHVLVRRRLHRRRLATSRRDLLRAGLAAGAVVAGYGATAGLARVVGAQPRTDTGSRPLPPAQVPATIWLFDRVPTLESATYAVDVAGRRIGLPELRERAVDVRARLDCTSGWYADLTWSAVPLGELLDPTAQAQAPTLRVTSVTGYRRDFPAADAARLFLAVAAEGRPLTAGGGAPVRLVVPGRRGFWWVKWVASVSLESSPWWRQPPFPLQ